jgi:hypothetical protein
MAIEFSHGHEFSHWWPLFSPPVATNLPATDSTCFRCYASGLTLLLLVGGWIPRLGKVSATGSDDDGSARRP